ncbi:MAG: Sec-independent protein translocase subunit TatA/TatB [Egibacteraceae bacterium]
MPNLGGPELLIALVVLVLLFGAKKLPELGSSVGRSIKNFKAGMAEAKAEDDAQERVTTPPSPKPEQQ